MLIEQAFFALPETLVGSGFAKQNYEASIVSAYSMSLLGELNGRNVSNPMSYIRAEAKFLPDRANLRADLNVRLNDLMTGSKALAQMGFRFDNWIEAKFFRGTAASTQNLGQVAADLVRLSALLPLEGNNRDLLPHGRYLLHAYLGDPLKFLAPRRKGRNEPDRAWIDPLLKPGPQTIHSLELDNESKTFYKHLGSGLRNCDIQLDIVNFIIAPPPGTPHPHYRLVLTRIDGGEVRFQNRTFSFRSNRSYEMSPQDEYDVFRLSIASALKSDKNEPPKQVDELAEPAPAR